MTGIQYVTDQRGKRVAVQIDLAIHGEWWEDLQDALVSQERRSEKGIPIEKVKARLQNSGKLREDL